MRWKDWNPGLNNGHLTIDEVRATLPGNQAQEIHFLVRLLENPSSPLAFKGAISLERHDYMHILLGRGLRPQDEAFVIGFTMGTSKKISQMETWLFQMASKYLYPKPYNFEEEDLRAFRLAIDAGKQSNAIEIYKAPLETYGHRLLADVRAELGIDVGFLRQKYAEEQLILPDTVESKRLPV